MFYVEIKDLFKRFGKVKMGLNFIINNLQPDGLLILKFNNGHFVHQKLVGFMFK